MNIVLTGTSRGIGLQLALLFAKNGHKVLALSRKNNEQLSQNTNIRFLSIDLSKENELLWVEKYVSNNWKHIDLLIHNAGFLINKPFEQISSEEFQYAYQVNVFAVANLTKLLLPFMQKGSHVMAISSMGAMQTSVKFAGLSAYTSSKAAVITLMELLAEEYKEKGILFNVLALGAVQTEMLEEAFPGYKAPVTASEMAEYIYNFSVNGAKFHNGKIIPVSSTTP